MRNLFIALTAIGLAAACAAPGTAYAQQVPDVIPHQGRILDGDVPLQGDYSVRFALYRSQAGGSSIWTDTQTVSFDAGYYQADLTFPTGAYDGAMWLGIQVGSDAELPRIPVNAVPFARYAAEAVDVTGDINPTSIAIGGSTIIDSTGQWVGSTAGLQGPPGEDADPADVASALAANTTFVDDIAAELAASYVSELQGPEGPQGPSGSPDTGEEILGKLAQVDGSGSGLDADTVDGLNPQDIADLVDTTVIPGAENATVIRVHAPGSGSADTTRSVRVGGVEAINFTNGPGIALLAVDRSSYDVLTTVDNVSVRRNFDVNDPTTGINAWIGLFDAVALLDFDQHIVVLASNGPIDRHAEANINGVVPVRWLQDLGADIQQFEVDPTDAFALVSYPDIGAGNGLSLLVDSGTGAAADLSALVADGQIVGLDNDATVESFSMPGAAFELNTYPTSVMVTPTNYTGNITYTDNQGRSWRGTPATTAICQDLMGSGARMCHWRDIHRFISAGAINAHGESDPEKITMPTVDAVLSDGGTDLYPGSTTSHLYADCYYFTENTSARRKSYYDPPESSRPYGAVYTNSCNSSMPLLCCR